MDVKQVILGAPRWFLLRGAACGVLQEVVAAVVGSVPVPVTDSRRGHPVPVTATTPIYPKQTRTLQAKS